MTVCGGVQAEGTGCGGTLGAAPRVLTPRGTCESLSFGLWGRSPERGQRLFQTLTSHPCRGGAMPTLGVGLGAALGWKCVWRCWWEQQPGWVSARNPPCASVRGPGGSPTHPPLGLFCRVGLLPCYGSGLRGPGRQRGWSPTASRLGALGAVPHLPGRCVSSTYQACACSGL